MVETGVFGDKNVKLWNNRSLFDDVREMICADGLVLSKSSLSSLTLSHTRARSVFFPSPCTEDTNKNNYMRSYFRFDNTKLFYLDNPSVDVYGIEYFENSPEYSVFKNWKNTPEQLLEMVTYDIVDTTKCY